jgi:hypothetical protein
VTQVRREAFEKEQQQALPEFRIREHDGSGRMVPAAAREVYYPVTYLEPLTPEYLEAIIARDKPDALLPNLGGQSALNLTAELHRQGVLNQYGIRVIGTRQQSGGRIDFDRDESRRSLHDRLGNTIERDAHVLDPHRQRRARPGFTLTERFRIVESNPHARRGKCPDARISAKF